MISTIETHDDGAARPRRCASNPLVAIRRGDVASMVATYQPRPQRRHLMTFTDRLDETTPCGACGQFHGPALTDCDLYGPDEFAALLAFCGAVGVDDDPDPALVAAYAATIERAVDGRW